MMGGKRRESGKRPLFLFCGWVGGEQNPAAARGRDGGTEGEGRGHEGSAEGGKRGAKCINIS